MRSSSHRRGGGSTLDRYEAKRVANEYLRGTGLIASRAARHRDAWVVGYVEADNPDAMLDGGG